MTSANLYLNGRYLSQAMTGVQRHAAELVRAMDRRLQGGDGNGLTVAMLAPRNAADEPVLRRISVRRVGWLTGQAWEQIELPWLARGGVLMSFGSTGPLAHGQQAVTLHDAGVYAVPDSYSVAFRTWYRVLFPLLGRRGALIVTDSAFSRDELVRYVGLHPDRVEVVPCGCEHILATPSEPEILRRTGLHRHGYVLAAGGYAPRKNLGLVERALALLGPDAPRLAVVGAPNPRVFGASATTRNAVVLGQVNDAELRALYENALCLAYPSLYEGFGLPPLEAMACGCPAIVAHTSSLPEVCGDAVRYVDPHDAAGLAREVHVLLSDPAQRAALQTAGRARAAIFTWDRAAARTLTLARRLAGLAPETDG